MVKWLIIGEIAILGSPTPSYSWIVLVLPSVLHSDAHGS